MDDFSLVFSLPSTPQYLKSQSTAMNISYFLLTVFTVHQEIFLLDGSSYTRDHVTSIKLQATGLLERAKNPLTSFYGVTSSLAIMVQNSISNTVGTSELSVFFVHFQLRCCLRFAAESVLGQLEMSNRNSMALCMLLF